MTKLEPKREKNDPQEAAEGKNSDGLVVKYHPMTATQIKEGWARGCNCGNCEYCHVKESIEAKQKAILEPLINNIG